jgi:hypothetical protein
LNIPLGEIVFENNSYPDPIKINFNLIKEYIDFVNEVQ